MLETKAYFYSYYLKYHTLHNEKLALACSKDICPKTVRSASRSKKRLMCMYRRYRHVHPHIV